MAGKNIDYNQLKGLAKNPPNALSTEERVAQQEEKLKDYKEELKKVNSILVAGVIVLLVMVATLMAMLLINYITSFDNYTNMKYQQGDARYQLLQQRINRLEKMSK